MIKLENLAGAMQEGTGMKEKKIQTSQIGYYCFYTAVLIEVMIVIIDKSSFINPIEGRLFQLTFILCFLKVGLTKYTPREYVVIALFCVLGGISYLVTGRNEMIRLVMLVAACKDVDVKKCLKWIFWLTLAGCFVIIFLSVTGIYGALSLTEDYGRGGVETRYTLGMGHPNALQCMVWALTTLGLYLYAEKMKWYSYLGVMVVNFGFYLLTGSRTSMLASFVVIGLNFLVTRGKNVWFENAGCFLGAAITVFSVGISIAIAGNADRVYNYNWYGTDDRITMFFVKLNDILNGRIRTLSGTTRFEGTISTWKLFSAPENNYFFDMGWVRLFYWYGIIPAVIFIMVLAVVMIYCWKQKEYTAFVMIVSFALYSIIEAHAVSVYLARNYTFFLCGAYWYKIIREKSSESINHNTCL